MAGVLGVLVVVCYIPAMGAGFVWDDSILVQDYDLHQRSGWRSIWFSPSDIGEAHYWPVTYTTFWIEHQLWGLNPLGYHLTNIALHLVNSLLVWRLMVRLQVAGAAVIGAVFAVHPLHVESVAWIIERKDVLSGLLYLSAVFSWIRFTESPTARRYMSTWMLYAAGMLAKSVVVTLPATLLIWHWRQHGRITRGNLVRIAPFFATGFAVALADLAFYSAREPLSLGYSPLERTVIAARALWFYAGKLLWPTDLQIIYPHWNVNPTSMVNLAFIVAALAVVIVLWLTRRSVGRGPLAGILFFIVTLVPTLGFIDYGYMQFSFVADRFQYLAGIGVIAIIVAAATLGFDWLIRRIKTVTHKADESHPNTKTTAQSGDRLARSVKIVSWGAVIAVVMPLGVLTWRHASIYRDQVTLFKHIIEHNPQARFAHASLGSGYAQAGRYEEAIAVSEIALERTPEDVGLYANIALAHMHLGRLDLAEDNMRIALELEPKNAELMYKMGVVLRSAERHEEAVEQYRSAVAIDHEIPEAHAGMGISLYELNQHEAALEALGEALALAPDIHQVSEVHRYSAMASRTLGDTETAVHHYEKAIKSDPSNENIAIELAALLFTLGRQEEADTYFRHTQSQRPNTTDTSTDTDTAGTASSTGTLHLFNFTMGEQLRSQGMHKQAIEAYRAALEHHPEHARSHAGLGESLYRENLHEQAIEQMKKALELQVDSNTERALRYLIADAYEQTGDVQQATAHLEKALEIDKSFTEAIDKLARLHFSQQNYTNALQHFENLTELQPDNVENITNIGVTLFYLGRSEEALAQLDEALALDPTYETAIANRTEILRSIQDMHNISD